MAKQPSSRKLQPDGTPDPTPGSSQKAGADPAPGQASSGDTRVSRGNEAKPRLPHERDQSADSQVDKAPADDGRARQAHDDVERGVVDTDRGPVIDQTYERVRRP
jgi:hypothetical protein